MSGEGPRRLREVVGERVRELREMAGVRQDDLAKLAGFVGLAWNRSRIAAIERGAKPIHVEDLAHLAVLLAEATQRPVALADLVDLPGPIALTRTAWIEGEDLAELLRGRAAALDDLRIGLPAPLVYPVSTTKQAAGEAVSGRVNRILGLQRRPDDVSAVLSAELQAIAGALGEADERARRALNERHWPYVAACHRLWGRSLSAERDARLGAGPPASPASASARRGRITRDLLAELRDLLERTAADEDA